MLQYSGDLVAKILTEGDKVKKASLYGLAASYKTECAMLVILHLDFMKNKSQIYISHEPVDMCNGINWLLNCITLCE